MGVEDLEKLKKGAVYIWRITVSACLIYVLHLGRMMSYLENQNNILSIRVAVLESELSNCEKTLRTKD